jgi:hypothetical protein
VLFIVVRKIGPATGACGVDVDQEFRVSGVRQTAPSAEPESGAAESVLLWSQTNCTLPSAEPESGAAESVLLWSQTNCTLPCAEPESGAAESVLLWSQTNCTLRRA